MHSRTLIFFLVLTPWSASSVGSGDNIGHISEVLNTVATSSLQDQPVIAQEAIRPTGPSQRETGGGEELVPSKRPRLLLDSNGPYGRPHNERPQATGDEERRRRQHRLAFDLNQVYIEGSDGDDEDLRDGDKQFSLEQGGTASGDPAKLCQGTHPTGGGEASMPQLAASFSPIDQRRHPDLVVPVGPNSNPTVLSKNREHSRQNNEEGVLSGTPTSLRYTPGGDGTLDSIDSRLQKYRHAEGVHLDNTLTLSPSTHRLLPSTSANAGLLQPVRCYQLIDPEFFPKPPLKEFIIPEGIRVNCKYLGENTGNPSKLPELFEDWESYGPQDRLDTLKSYLFDGGKLYQSPELLGIDNYVEWTLKRIEILTPLDGTIQPSLGDLLGWNVQSEQSIQVYNFQGQRALAKYFDLYDTKYRPSVLPGYRDTKAMMMQLLSLMEVEMGSRRLGLLELDKSVDDFFIELQKNLEAQWSSLAQNPDPTKTSSQTVQMARLTTVSLMNKIIVYYRVFTPFNERSIIAMRQDLLSCFDLLKPFWEHFLSSEATREQRESSLNPFIRSAQDNTAYVLNNFHHILWSCRWQSLSHHLLEDWLQHLNVKKFAFLSMQDSTSKSYAFAAFLSDCTIADFVDKYKP